MVLGGVCQIDGYTTARICRTSDEIGLTERCRRITITINVHTNGYDGVIDVRIIIRVIVVNNNVTKLDKHVGVDGGIGIGIDSVRFEFIRGRRIVISHVHTFE